MKRPPTLLDLIGSPLLAADATRNHLYLQMTDGAVHVDCFDCQFYGIGDDAEGGEFCAFEAAGMIGSATPELCRLFGWTNDRTQPDCWYPPRRCPWFVDREAAPVPFDDPRQLDVFNSEAA